MKKKMCASLAFALISCLLVAAAAFAASEQWGILDFIASRFRVLPEAAQMVVSDIVQTGGENKYATFSVRQAAFDGESIYVVIAVKPTAEKYLPMLPDGQPSDPIQDLFPESKESMTIADYARANDKVMIYTSIFMERAETGEFGGGYSLANRMEEDGTFLYMLTARRSAYAKELALDLSCKAAPFVKQEDDDIVDTASLDIAKLSFTLNASDPIGRVTSVAQVEYAEAGVRVDKVTLNGTPLELGVRVEFTVIDEEVYAQTDDGLFFEFIDANGERLPGGPGIEEVLLEKNANGQYVQVISLQAVEKLPAEMIMRGFNCWEKNRYEAHTISFQ